MGEEIFRLDPTEPNVALVIFGLDLTTCFRFVNCYLSVACGWGSLTRPGKRRLVNKNMNGQEKAPQKISG